MGVFWPITDHCLTVPRLYTSIVEISESTLEEFDDVKGVRVRMELHFYHNFW